MFMSMFKKSINLVLLSSLMITPLLSVPAQTYAANESVEVWLTTADPNAEPAVGLSPSARLTKKANINFANSTGNADYTINVNEGKTYQKMDGFGVSLTDSATWLLNYKLSSGKRAEVMERLFGNTGIGMSMLRQTMGASDFAWSTYTYDDTAGDTSLSQFSIARDQPYIIPMTKAALAKNPNLKIIASPWSAPAWMKYTTNDKNGTGKLQAQYYPTYANYFVKFIQSYQAQGIPIYAVTPQNEPLFEPGRYPGMNMNEQDQIGMIGDYLSPALKNAGLNTKIIAYDHNYDNWSYPNTVITGLKNNGKSSAVAGSAFHHYGGDYTAMTSMHNAHPDKDIWFTEGGFGDWNDPINGTTQGFDNMINEFIGITRNWSKSIILWNAALDQKDGPSVIGDKNTNKGMVTIQNSDNSNSNPEDQVTYGKQYYLLGHFSKFVVTGATRIDTNSSNDIQNVAFKNPDGTKVVVLYNSQTATKTVKVQWNGQSTNYTVPGKSVVTLKW